MNDLVIFPDHLKNNWFRDAGHMLTLKDLEDILAAKPRILVIGTGHSGVMKVDREVKEYCRKNGIRLVEAKTADAVREYNRLEGQETIGAFHLTC